MKNQINKKTFIFSIVIIFIFIIGLTYLYLFRTKIHQDEYFGEVKYCYSWGKLERIELYSKNDGRLISVINSPTYNIESGKTTWWAISQSEYLDSDGDGNFDIEATWGYKPILLMVKHDSDGDGIVDKKLTGDQAQIFLDELNKKLLNFKGNSSNALEH